MKAWGAFLLGALLAAAAGAVAVQQAPTRYHGFSLNSQEWVVVDGQTGVSCRYRQTDRASAALADARRAMEAETDPRLREVIRMGVFEDADCRDTPIRP